MSTYHTPHQQHHSDNEMMIISQQQQQVTDKTIIDDTNNNDINHDHKFSKNENSYPSSSSDSEGEDDEDDEEEDYEDDDNEDDSDGDDDDDYEEEMFTIQAADGPYLIDLDTAMLCSALRKQLMQDSNHRTFTISNVRRKSLEKVFDWCRFHCPQKKPTTTATTPSTKSISHSSVSHTPNSTSTNDEYSSSLSSSLTMLNESNDHHHHLHHHHVNTSNTIMTTHHNQNSENTNNKKKNKRRKKKKKTVLRKPVIDLTRRPSTEERKRYDRKLVDAEPSDLCELASASYYLQIRPLVDLTCQSIATLIKGKTPEEVRETFNIANDFIHNNANHHNGIHGGGGDANGSEANGVQSDEAETTMVAQAALKSKNRNSMIGPPSMSHLHHLHHHHHHPMGLHSAKNSPASKSWLHRNYPFTNNPEVIERMRATDPLSMPYDKMNEPTTTSKSKKKNQKKKKKKAEKRKLKDKRSVDDLVSFITADDAKKKPTQHQQKSKKKDKKKKPQQKANDSSLSSKSSVLGTSTAASSVSSATSVNSEADIESEASSNSTEQVDHHDADSIASNFYYSDEEEERMALDNNFDFNSLMHQIQSQSYDDELAVAEEEEQFEEQEENVNVDDHLTESIEQEEEAQDHSSSPTTEEGIPNENPVLTTTLESTVARQEQTETESPKESNPAPTESLDDISSVDELLQRINQVEQELERERTENQMVLSQLQQRTSFLESQLAQQAQQMYGMYNLVVEQQAYIQRLTQPSSFHVNEFYQQQQHVENYHTVGPVGSVRQPTPPNAHQKLFEMFPQSSPTVVPSLSPTSPLPSPDLFNGINQPRNPSPSLFSTGGPTGYLYKK